MLVDANEPFALQLITQVLPISPYHLINFSPVLIISWLTVVLDGSRQFNLFLKNILVEISQILWHGCSVPVVLSMQCEQLLGRQPSQTQSASRSANRSCCHDHLSVPPKHQDICGQSSSQLAFSAYASLSRGLVFSKPGLSGLSTTVTLGRILSVLGWPVHHAGLSCSLSLSVRLQWHLFPTHDNHNFFVNPGWKSVF